MQINGVVAAHCGVVNRSHVHDDSDAGMQPRVPVQHMTLPPGWQIVDGFAQHNPGGVTMRHPPALHHTIVVTDTENFTDPSRTNLDQLAIRHALYKILKYAFGQHWPTCHTEDRGDGVLILVPPHVPKIYLATRMLTQLETGLIRHNMSCSPHATIRLRVALHAGEVHHDRHGVTGTAINHTFRLIDAPSFKAAFNASLAPCAVIVSAWFYDEVIRHYPTAQRGAYRPAVHRRALVRNFPIVSTMS